jgi:hypothetical protein
MTRCSGQGETPTNQWFADPDGYWIEVVQNEKLKPRCNW